jgi:hypothetical protein
MLYQIKGYRQCCGMLWRQIGLSDGNVRLSAHRFQNVLTVKLIVDAE